jgi:RHS repeat-associated protein
VETRYGYCGAYGYQGSPYPGVPEADPLADLGWFHVGARYYDPSSGRFVQRDPIGINGGLNSYVYCGNMPTIGADPSGQLPVIPLLLAIIIAIDYGAQYANAPSTGDSIHRGGAGSSPVGWGAAAALGSWLVRGICGGAEAAGRGAPSGNTNPLDGLSRTGSALKGDPYHSFPDIVDNYAGGAADTALESGATLYQLEGSLNGVAGRFEWIVSGGEVMHRFFVRGGVVNGIPITP